MKTFDQVILVLYTISLAVISWFLLLMAFGWEAPQAFLFESFADPTGRIIIGLAAAVFFATSLRILYFAFGGRRSGGTLVHESSLGEVQISLRAIENLIEKAGRQVEGVRDLGARVESGEGGIQVLLRGSVSPEVSIPEISDRLQNIVRRHVHSVVGVEVEQVKVHVENIGDSRRRRA